MKFYGNGIVWNAQENRSLCKFEKGEFITEDENVIKTLTNLGYKHDPPTIKPTVVKKEKVIKSAPKRLVNRKKAVKK